MCKSFEHLKAICQISKVPGRLTQAVKNIVWSITPA